MTRRIALDIHPDERRTIRLASAYCPDVPRSREGRAFIMHGEAVKPETYSGLGRTCCGLFSNEADVVTHPDLVRVCKRCLRNQVFAATVDAFRAAHSRKEQP